MVCSVKVGSVVALEDAGCIYLSLVCGAKKIAEFCLSEEEYLSLGEPKPGDVVDFGATTTTYHGRSVYAQAGNQIPGGAPLEYER